MNLPLVRTAAEPRVAIVIPVFRHSVLVAEAIGSALAQEAPFPLRIVLVNDGCPMAETDRVCAEHAEAHPDRIAYLRTPNGGLSAARNRGTAHALATWPTVEAIYFLDADNRIRPHLVARAMAALEADPAAGWVYPHIDMFGLSWAGDFGGDFSLLIQSAMNACEAGSLVHRRVFEAGVAFDTSMKLGFEDWDFFLTAARAGFRGINAEDLGFRYRKRPESMLADSHRAEEAIRGQMLAKHPWLRRPGALVALEQAEAPRYAIFLADRGQYLLTTDPEAPARTLDPAAFDRLFWASRTSPGRQHAPAHLVVTTSAAMERLGAARLLHWAFWRLEELAGEAPIAALTLGATGSEACRVAAGDASGGAHLAAAILTISPGALDAVLRDSHSTWIDTLSRAECEPPVATLGVELPGRADDSATTGGAPVVHAFLGQVHLLRGSRFRAASERRWDWRAPGVAERPRAHDCVRRLFDGRPAFPRGEGAGPTIGLVLPLVSFGGVERVALATARALKARGWRPQLVVAESDAAALGPEWRETVETVSFLSEPEIAAWDGAEAYAGTDIPPWAREGDQSRADALLSWMDVVVNAHAGALHGLMGRLRRRGVTTVAALHLSDRTARGRPVGHTYLGLAYEHAYDLVTTCSHGLARWCHAMGVPEAKLVPVPNAPGYPVTAGEIADATAAREERQGPLRVLFLGRLDRQKGLEHLAEMIGRARRAGLAIEWRVAGRPVLGDADAVPEAVRAVLEPPVPAGPDLTALYAWADVLLLPSAYEGLPLTVLEAMRLGAVPLVTDVGHIREAVSDGETGIVLADGPRFAETALARLAQLAGDRARLSAMAAAAAAAMDGRDWSGATAQLAARLEALVPMRAHGPGAG